jgi:hypothetical protein
MNTLTEGQTPGDFLLFEEQDNYCNDAGVIGAGANLQPGHVVGQVTANKKFVAWNPTASDGSETVAGILRTPAAAATADVPGAIIITRGAARVRRGGLLFADGLTSEQRDTACAALQAKGIRVT